MSISAYQAVFHRKLILAPTLLISQIIMLLSQDASSKILTLRVMACPASSMIIPSKNAYNAWLDIVSAMESVFIVLHANKESTSISGDALKSVHFVILLILIQETASAVWTVRIIK